MDKKIIVAIEIGSSKIKGLAAAVDELGNIEVLASEECKVNDCVRYGRIQNAQVVSTHLTDIIRKIENSPKIYPRHITDVYVAIGGRSLSTLTAKAQTDFEKPLEITSDIVDRLKREAAYSSISDKKTLDMLPLATYVDNSEVKNVVGSIGRRLHTLFTVVAISPDNLHNLDLVKIDNRTITRHNVTRQLALADMILTVSDRKVGCALVDFGAETTTISIYKNDALQKIVTLPVGSRNITRDLVNGLSMAEDRAEAAKIAYGQNTTIDEATASEIAGYVSARADEIANNISHQLELADFKAQQLGAGIILTGGGARLDGFVNMLSEAYKAPVKIANPDVHITGLPISVEDNLDILSIVLKASKGDFVDCLGPMPEDYVEPEIKEPVIEDTVTVSTPGYQRRSVAIDDVDLLNDDPDEEEAHTGAKVKRLGKVKGHPSVVKNNPREPEPEVVEFDNEPNDGEKSQDKGLYSSIKSLKNKISSMWQSSLEVDDLDEEAE